MVLLVHLDGESIRRREGLTGHCNDDLVDVGGLGLFDSLLPHVYADVCGFHRIVGQRLVGARQILGLGICSPLLLELLVGRVLERHEVIPCSKMAHQRLGVDTAKLVLTDRKCDDRNVGRLQSSVAQLLVERHV